MNKAIEAFIILGLAAKFGAFRIIHRFYIWTGHFSAGTDCLNYGTQTLWVVP